MPNQDGTLTPEESAKLAEFRKKTPSKSAVKAGTPGIKLTPEEEAVRAERATSTPEKYVTDEEYDKLAKLYDAAQKSSGGNPNKKTKQTEEFQKLYHELLPDEARRIIAADTKLTTKGEQDIKTGKRRDPYNLEDNVDGMFGRRTEQYWQAVKKKPVVPAAAVPPEEKAKIPAERGPIERHPPVDLGKKTYAPWWLQDIVKTSGAAADLARVKPYYPWQAIPETRLPDATFYDPTRAEAAISEQANLANQYAAAFTGPRAASQSQIAGKAMSQVADTIAKYDDMNVQVANKLSDDRTSIMNQASQNKAALDTQLFDKYTIANQQLDNSKAMARQNLRQSYIDAITNRAKTQALNTLYPNFYTNPMTGGFVNFKPGYGKIQPTAQGSDEADEVQKIVHRFPGTTAKEAYDIVRKNKGTGEEDPNQGYLRSQGYSGQ